MSQVPFLKSCLLVVSFVSATNRCDSRPRETERPRAEKGRVEGGKSWEMAKGPADMKGASADGRSGEQCRQFDASSPCGHPPCPNVQVVPVLLLGGNEVAGQPAGTHLGLLFTFDDSSRLARSTSDHLCLYYQQR